jgi:hypothetical protein
MNLESKLGVTSPKRMGRLLLVRGRAER